jgi:uncharacterized protein YjbI with pentapeptide repeats
MKLSFSTALWGSMLACILSGNGIFAQEDTNEKKVEYKHSFEGEDLSDRDFSKQNLDNTNFADTILTKANFEGASLKNCNFQGATLKHTNFRYTDMSGSDFRKCTIEYPSFDKVTFNGANFSGVDFSGTNTHEMKFRGANLRGAKGFNQSYKTDYYGADFRGTDFSAASLLNGTNFRKVKYDQFTRWPKGFDVAAHGLEFIETKEDDMDSPKVKPKKGGDEGEADFQKLDKNEDGVLSGAEMKGLNEKDTNEDGEISLSEFLSDK